MPLLQSRRHLNNAAQAINQMRSARSFEAYESSWRQFLQELNKIWKKVELECKKNPKFNGWRAKYITLRKDDALLCYLHHARNSDEHTLTEITKRVPGSLAISAPPETGFVHIRSLTITADGGVQYDGSPAVFQVTPPSVQLDRVRDRGTWYEVPEKHLDADLVRKDPLEVADCGLKFYTEFVKEAEDRFA
jgi:hypothetical protein